MSQQIEADVRKLDGHGFLPLVIVTNTYNGGGESFDIHHPNGPVSDEKRAWELARQFAEDLSNSGPITRPGG